MIFKWNIWWHENKNQKRSAKSNKLHGAKLNEK